ncbi:MAG: hypothetical protein QGH11_07500, partial [Pirellulaceae bacterium]|nr:hypothetical protein [Pirellulaceae bacterium]
MNRVVQFISESGDRRVGVVRDDQVLDLTAAHGWQSTRELFQAAIDRSISLASLVSDACSASDCETISYDALWNGDPEVGNGHLLAPLDHPEHHRIYITGTGLTHTGSMQSRNQMHGGGANTPQEEPATDSARMFAMGLEGGKPEAGKRGVSPEWFYKGNGANLRGHRQSLDLPAFALDGGEEPEIVGCYVIDEQGTPRRLGFALGNEWSDHANEKINYLYLAPSKIRSCAVGPELVLDSDFQEITLECLVERDGKAIYESGKLKSGEQFMCHSLANCEDHHFKYPLHR